MKAKTRELLIRRGVIQHFALTDHERHLLGVALAVWKSQRKADSDRYLRQDDMDKLGCRLSPWYRKQFVAEPRP